MVAIKALLAKHFTLSEQQLGQFEKLEEVVTDINQRINLISRKDMEYLAEHHILHSLAIGYHYPFAAGSKVLDVGTGGGFPGIPLAIMFPDSEFFLIDGTLKKIKAVNEIIDRLELKNVKAKQIRAEEFKPVVNFVVSRAVTDLPTFSNWVVNNIKSGSKGGLPQGIIYLRGNDFDFGTINDLINPGFDCCRRHSISEIFPYSYFDGKLVVFLKKL